MNARKILVNLRSTSPFYRFIIGERKTSATANVFIRRRIIKPVSTSDFCCVMNNYVRNYAKGMNKPKKEGKRKVEYREDILSDYWNVEKIKIEMNDIVDRMQDQYQKHVSVRSAVGSIETLPIEFDGSSYIIQDLAQINRRNPKVVALNFSSFPQAIPTVLNALQESGLNVNPQQDGTSVFIPVPKVTREYREQLSKSANAFFVKYRTELKQIQAKYIKKLELREGISVEQAKIVQEQLQVLADSYIAKLEIMKNDKVKELLRDD